ncbi:hypothetical protein ACTFIW_011033 [Dictyostelium discoideum]
MSTNKKIKTDNNNKIFQDIIDFEILKSIINYLLISKNNNNNNNNSNKYKINKFYLNRNEILNYILVSKKWYNFISLTISNNIINNKSFEHWLNIDYINSYNSFIENYNNQNQYDKNNLIFKNKYNKQNKINYNKGFSIIKIKESIIDDYFKFNLFLDDIEIEEFIEIKNKFENNQLLFNRIVVNDGTLFEIHEYLSNVNSETISNLFKILELNYDVQLDGGYSPNLDENENEGTGLYLNNLSISGYNDDVVKDRETVKIFKIFKGKNLIYKRSQFDYNCPTHTNYSALFDPDNSGQQVESIKVIIKTDGDGESVEARHLIKVNQFENLHSITIPIYSFQILSNLSEEMGFYKFYRNCAEFGNSGTMESKKLELNQMINSFVTSKSLKNLNISSVNSNYSISYKDYSSYDDGDREILANNINENIESFANSFKPLFSELNTSIERIEFDCCGLLNIDTFSNLLNNKSIKYLYLNNCDFIVHSPKPIDSELYIEPISVNQYLFENIFTSPLTSIRHYRIRLIELKQLKLIFNLILNNIFKLQLYSLIFEFNEKELIGEFVKEFKNLINNIIPTQQKSNNINLKEIKIKIKQGEYIQELNNINNPYFTTTIKKIND